MSLKELKNTRQTSLRKKTKEHCTYAHIQKFKK